MQSIHETIWETSPNHHHHHITHHPPTTMARRKEPKPASPSPAELQRIKEEDAGTIKEREARADVLYRDLKDDMKSYFETRDLMIRAVKSDVQTICPFLDPDPSPEDCLLAAKTFEMRFEDLVKDMKIPRKELKEKSQELTKRRVNLSSLYYRLIEKVRSPRRIDEFSNRYCEFLWNHPSQIKEFEEVEREAAGSRDLVNFQNRMHSLMAGQSDEAKELVLLKRYTLANGLARRGGLESWGGHVSRAGCHVSRTGDHVSCPDGSQRHVSPPLRQVLQIPPEIATMIHFFCNLETSVILRQVNQCFYSAFTHNETMFKSKVLARFPWARLELEISSWCDYALVYTSRVSGGKWQFKTRLEHVRDTLDRDRRDRKVGVLICQQLETEEDLPEGFESFGEARKAGPRDPCEHHVINQTEEELVIQCEEEGESVKITLPPHLDPETLFVTISRECVVVVTEGGSEDYLFSRSRDETHGLSRESHGQSRDQPHGSSHHYHFKNALRHPGVSWAWSIADIFGIGEKVWPIAKSYGFYYGNDGDSKKLHKLDPADSADPVASYNGLIWWYMKPSSLVPTFFDMETPDRIYYRSDKIVRTSNWTGRSSHIGQYHNYRQYRRDGHGGNRHGGNRFVTVDSQEGMSVVDLARSTVIDVQPYGGLNWEDNGKFVAGWNKGRFDVRYVNHGNYC